MAQHFPGKKSEEYRRMLGQFGVTGDLALQQVKLKIKQYSNVVRKNIAPLLYSKG